MSEIRDAAWVRAQRAVTLAWTHSDVIAAADQAAPALLTRESVMVWPHVERPWTGVTVLVGDVAERFLGEVHRELFSRGFRARASWVTRNLCDPHDRTGPHLLVVLGDE